MGKDHLLSKEKGEKSKLLFSIQHLNIESSIKNFYETTLNLLCLVLKD